MTSAPSPGGSSRITALPTMPRTRHFADRFYREGRSPRGPVSFLNPTRAHFPLRLRRPTPALRPLGPIYHVWRSRDNRKGRHAAVVSKKQAEDERVEVPRATDTSREVARGVWRMAVRYPVWDISYDVAVIFTLGMRAGVPLTPL